MGHKLIPIFDRSVDQAKVKNIFFVESECKYEANFDLGE
jgi:hypothetical protein